MGPPELTTAIKHEALRLGFDAVGIARAERLPEAPFEEWLRRGYHGTMDYLQRSAPQRLDPNRVLAGVKSVVAAALLYRHPDDRRPGEKGRGVVSRYARGADYHDLMTRRLEALLGFVRSLAPAVRGRICVDSGPVHEKEWAVRAGLGWLGKHTNVVSRRLGSWFFLGVVLLDLDLEYDSPEAGHCGTCSRCIEACPTRAIVQPFVVDARRCVSYLTIELRGDIPEEFRRSMGSLVFGCDVCQEVCPWNRKAPWSRVPEFAAQTGWDSPILRELACLSSADFSSSFRASAIRRAKWRGLLRNAAVAMGNQADPETAPDLNRLLNCDDGMVRRHAAWALAETGAPAAFEALKQRQAVEQDTETRDAIETLLTAVHKAPLRGASAARHARGSELSK
jgi:epoxyqueuosine reductase